MFPHIPSCHPRHPSHPHLEALRIKALIRSSEAREAALYCGVRPENIHFLELPFYQTGRVKKNPIGDADIRIVQQLLEQVRPQQVYAAGDLSDPHGTHRQCTNAVICAMMNCSRESLEWALPPPCAGTSRVCTFLLAGPAGGGRGWGCSPTLPN